VRRHGGQGHHRPGQGHPLGGRERGLDRGDGPDDQLPRNRPAREAGGRRTSCTADVLIGAPCRTRRAGEAGNVSIDGGRASWPPPGCILPTGEIDVLTENGLQVDFEALEEILRRGDVITIGFTLFPERVLVDTRSNDREGPLAVLAPPVSTVQE